MPLRLSKSALTSAELLARLSGQDVVLNKVTASTSAGLLIEASNGTDVVTFGPGGGSAAAFNGGITCAAITSTSASGITTHAAATQDAIALVGRAGGTSSYVATLTPGTLTASRTFTLPDMSGTVVVSGASQQVTLGSSSFGGSVLSSARIHVVQSADTSNPAIRLSRADNDSFLQIGYRSGDAAWGFDASYASTGAYLPIVWKTSDAVRMHLDTAGNLGVGVTPSYRLHVQGPSGIVARITDSLRTVDVTIGATCSIGTTGIDPFTFRTANIDRVHIDTSGLVGIGTTPVAGNGLLQLASGTDKSKGIAFYDTFLHRIQQGAIRLDGNGFADPEYRLYGASSGSTVDVAVGLNSAGTFYVYDYTNAKYRIQIDTSQNADLAGNINVASGKTYKVAGTQVIAARRTGWTAQTATASRADLGASPTVGAIAGFLRALYDDLAAHGVIGA